jgi:hypothetical protein
MRNRVIEEGKEVQRKFKGAGHEATELEFRGREESVCLEGTQGWRR